MQVVTGFLGKGVHTGAITTLGRGGSDLTATVLGAAMDLNEVQVGHVEGEEDADIREASKQTRVEGVGHVQCRGGHVHCIECEADASCRDGTATVLEAAVADWDEVQWVKQRSTI